MEKRLTLMNRKTPVLSLTYDYDLHVISRIDEYHNPEYMPPGIIGLQGMPNRKTINEWWRARAIPASRQHLHTVMDMTNETDPVSLVEQNFGLSLSDQYWMNDPEHPQKWEDINFFHNPFSNDLGMLTLGEDFVPNPDLYSPNSTLNGDLQKKWAIMDGKRVLLKSGTGMTGQERYNEVIATALHRRLLQPEDFVPYWLYETDGCTYSACPNMIADEEELVPMWDYMRQFKHRPDKNDYQFIRDICEQTGIKNVDVFFTKMFTCDAILANSDRHYRNFGLIRNVETLQYTRLAPIYDSGRCLWCDKPPLPNYDYLIDYDYMAKPFGINGMPPEKQLRLFYDYTWFDETKLEGFTEEAVGILRQNKDLTAGRIDAIAKGLSKTVEMVVKHVSA